MEELRRLPPAAVSLLRPQLRNRAQSVAASFVHNHRRLTPLLPASPDSKEEQGQGGPAAAAPSPASNSRRPGPHLPLDTHTRQSSPKSSSDY